MESYHYDSFFDLFHNEITYAAEANYPPYMYTHGGYEYVRFYRLTLCSKGLGSYKTSQFTFSIHIWPKIKKLAEMLIETPAEKVLYGKPKKES